MSFLLRGIMYNARGFDSHVELYSKRKERALRTTIQQVLQRAVADPQRQAYPLIAAGQDFSADYQRSK